MLEEKILYKDEKTSIIEKEGEGCIVNYKSYPPMSFSEKEFEEIVAPLPEESQDYFHSALNIAYKVYKEKQSKK